MTRRTGDNRPTIIYGLIDPRDGQLHYIGKTVDLQKRVSNHLTNDEIVAIVASFGCGMSFGALAHSLWGSGWGE